MNIEHLTDWQKKGEEKILFCKKNNKFYCSAIKQGGYI